MTHSIPIYVKNVPIGLKIVMDCDWYFFGKNSRKVCAKHHEDTTDFEQFDRTQYPDSYCKNDTIVYWRDDEIEGFNIEKLMSLSKDAIEHSHEYAKNFILNK